MMIDSPIVVFCTVGSEPEALTISRAIVTEKLAACATLLPGVRSIYTWKGELCDEREVFLIFKTSSALFEALRERIVELHSYEVPEIIALPIQSGHEPYLRWLDENIRSS